MLRVLTLTATIDGRPLDLSACTVEVEVTLSAQMLEQLEAFSENQPLGISADGEGAVDGDEAEAAVPSLTLVAYSEETGGAVNELGSVTVNDLGSAAEPEAQPQDDLHHPGRRSDGTVPADERVSGVHGGVLRVD